MRGKLKNRLALGGYLAAVALIGFLFDAIAAWLSAGGFSVLATALAADRITQRKLPGLKSYPVKDGAKIFKGGMVMIQADGHAVPAADAAASKVVGVATETKDNTAGADGDLWVDVEEGLFLLPASSITQAMVGQMMYVVDDQTFDDALGTNAVKAGILVEFVSTTSGWIRIEEPKGVGTALADAGATYTSAEQNLINALKAGFNKWL